MNKDNYKKAIDQIHPSDDLKQRTLDRIVKKEEKKSPYMKYIAVCTMILMICFLGQSYLLDTQNVNQNNRIATETKIEKIKNDLPRFESMQQLKDVLKENHLYRTTINATEELADSITKGESVATESLQNKEQASTTKDFSTTNVQVENVDEADTVKTDGEYIYHVTDNKVLIIKADTLEVIFTIDENLDAEDKNSRFAMHEIFVNGNFLVILGNELQYQETKTRINSITEEEKIVEDLAIADVAMVRSKQTAKAIIYDISDKKSPILKREVELAGYYSNSRMIGDYVYFISTQSAYYTSQMKDEEILPFYRDTVVSQEKSMINYSDIAYFEGTNNYNFTLVAGFNITNKEEISLETFLGASGTVYASEKNLYLAQVTYSENDYRAEKSTIYKFNLDKGQIILQCKGEVKGDLNNQFSMDEYDGNLRIATTAYDEENESTNQLYILDKDLKEIGRLDNLATGERIYAVRLIGKIGYIVTFKQIDPLFVIDLEDPTTPQVKGELKIPGYSSYLHPYDETHIIGIGYNTKTNKYGNVTRENMKMSMFDVSDLENPKEIFSIDIGENYAYSEITYNHKALFYNSNKSLIGLPVTLREYSASKDTNNFILYKIDLENGFQEYGRIQQKINYKTNINRAIYIGDTLYTLSETKMVSYDLNTMEKQKELVYFEDENKENGENTILE